MSPSLEEQRLEVLNFTDRLTEAQNLYLEGLRLLERDDYARASDLICRAAEMGNATAQCQFGFLHEKGFFGMPDLEMAVSWYRKSVEQCLPQGQFRLGACYQLGKGVNQDWKEAARLFELAARRGHAEAAQCLQVLGK